MLLSKGSSCPSTSLSGCNFKFIWIRLLELHLSMVWSLAQWPSQVRWRRLCQILIDDIGGNAWLVCLVSIKDNIKDEKHVVAWGYFNCRIIYLFLDAQPRIWSHGKVHFMMANFQRYSNTFINIWKKTQKNKRKNKEKNPNHLRQPRITCNKSLKFLPLVKPLVEFTFQRF